MKSRKERLLEVLKEEYENLPEHDMFGDSNHKEQYAAVFHYLETGDFKPSEFATNEFLESIVEDFDYNCSVYGIGEEDENS